MNTTILIPRRNHRPSVAQRLKRAMVETFESLQNFWLYVLRGHPPRTAWRMARNTLKGK